MISVSKAREILLESCERGTPVSRKLPECLGSVLAEDIHSPIDVPSFDNSAMDGYAMQFSEGDASWEVVSEIPAGDTSLQQLEEGQAARIFTGAKMPKGADTVIQQELIQTSERGRRISYQGDKITPGKNVRLKGTQCEKGERILEKGTPIGPGAIGLLASVGVSDIKVYPSPKLAYLITGNELKEVGETLAEGEIYNSNGPMLRALLEEMGIRDISALKASDEKEKLQGLINNALETHEALILSGGISVGDYDFVKECLEEAGVRELFYKVKQRPGKPFFAGKKDQKWVFALPGNPASVLSCFVQYVRPCLNYFMGKERVWNPDAILPLAQSHRKKPGFTFFVKARREGREVEALKGQQSFNLLAFNRANCLVELPEDMEEVPQGHEVKVYKI